MVRPLDLSPYVLCVVRQLLTIAAMLDHVTVSANGYNPTVCEADAYRHQTSLNPGRSMPQLARAYSVRVEGNLLEQQRTVDFRLHYDDDLNRVDVRQWDAGVLSLIKSDYSTGQLITVTFPDRAVPTEQYTRCHVGNVSSTLHPSLLFDLISYHNNSRHIYNFYNSTGEVYLGYLNLTDEGILVEGWRGCVYLPDTDTTFNATWYFTDSTWRNPMGTLVAPVALHVQGKRAGNHSFEHIYSFCEYQPLVQDHQDVSDFQVPQGVYCRGEISTMSLPNITDNFSFSSEVIDVATQTVTYMSEYYNYDMRVMRYEFAGHRDNHPFVRVHDFNTGVAYTIDSETDNCSVTKISHLGFDFQSSNAAFVRMRSEEDFFGLASHNYIYTGQRNVRDVVCDCWLAVNDDWPTNQPFETNWEWCFTSGQWIESVDYQYEARLPVQLRITAQGFDPPFERVFSLYDYRERQNRPWDYDISPCFLGPHNRHYVFILPGDYEHSVADSVGEFRRFFVVAVTAFANVSALRVARVTLDYDDVNIYVSFSLLDKAPIVGDVTDTNPELNLTLAAAKMEQTVTSGHFMVSWIPAFSTQIRRLLVTNFSVTDGPTQPPPSPPNTHHQPPQRRHTRGKEGYDSLLTLPQQQHGEDNEGEEENEEKERGIEFGVKAPSPPDESTTYSAGAMAGLGVGMVVVGYGTSFVAVLAAHRRWRSRQRRGLDNPLTVLPHS